MRYYYVKITDNALTDMEQLYNHIANVLLSPENAIGQYNRIADAILKLNQMPERFKVMDLESEYFKELRRMPVDNYSVFYVINDDTVIVTNVLYSASDIEQRLK